MNRKTKNNKIEIKIDGNKFPVLIVGRKNLSIIRSNFASEKFLGKLDFEKMRINKLLAFKSQKLIMKMRAGELVQTSFTAMFQKKVISGIINSIEYDNLPAYLISFSSAENDSTKSLKQSNQTDWLDVYKKTINSQKLCIVLFEINSGKIIDANALFYKQFKISSNGLSRRKISSFFNNTDLIKNIADLLPEKIGASTSHENVTMKSKGKVRLTANLEFIRIDDSEKCALIIRKVNKSLKINDEITKFSAVWESIEDCVIVTSTEGEVLSWNKGAAKLYGYRASEMIGKSLSLIFPRSSRNEFIEIIDKMKRGKKVINLESKRQNKKGEIIDVLTSVIPVKDSKGRFTAIYSLTRNLTPHKNIMEKLKETREMYRDLVELSPNIIGIYQKGKIVFLNPAGLKAWGVKSIKPLQNKNLNEILHPDDQSLFRIKGKKLHKGEYVFHGEMRIFKMNGSIMRLDISLKIFHYRGKNALLFVAKDISKKKEIEEEKARLLSVTKRYAIELDAVFECIPDAVFMGDENGIKRANKKLLKLYGCKSFKEFSNSHVKLFNIKDAQTKEPLKQGDDVFSKALKGISSVKEIILTDAKTNKEKVIRTAGAPIILENKIIAAVVINSDISERKRIENAVSESEKKYKALIEQSFDGIALIHVDGTIVMWNSRFAFLLGYRKEDIYNMNFLSNDSLGHHDFNTNKEFSSQIGKTLQFESKIRRKDESYFPAEIRIRVVDDGLIMWVIRDITERKASEEMRDKLFNRLVEAQSIMKTLSGRLIQVQETERKNISRELHDEIGQLLTAIKIDILNVTNSLKSKKAVEQLKESVQLVEETLNNVRELALKLRPSILDDLGLMAAVRWFLDKQAQRTGINAKVIQGNLDEKLSIELQITCYRIIQEAVTNIIKHAKAQNVSVELAIKANDLHLIITDDGIGYDVNAARLNAVSGYSMGVLGMQERAELVGGWLDIYSSPGKGTKVYAIFPLKVSSQK